MIEIDHTLLSKEALNNLIIDIVTRQGTNYGEYEIDIQVKKKQLLHNLHCLEMRSLYTHLKRILAILLDKKIFSTLTNYAAKISLYFYHLCVTNEKNIFVTCYTAPPIIQLITVLHFIYRNRCLCSIR